MRRSLGTTSEVTIHSFARARALTIASIALLAAACGSTSNPTGGTTQAGDPNDNLSVADVQAIIGAAAGAISDDLAIAVVDRSGTILGVYSRGAGGVNDTTPNVAVSLARTTGYFSNNVAPLASRTVRYISGIHFPPAPLPSEGEDQGGVRDAPNAPLYGVENINRGCQLDAAGDAVFTGKYADGVTQIKIDRPRSLKGLVNNLPCNPVDQSGCAIGGPIQETDGSLRYTFGITTGKADLFDSKEGLEESINPGAVPLYRNKKLLGGIGVVMAGPRDNAKVEYAAVIGAAGNGRGITTAIDFPNPLPVPGAIFIDGFRLPFVAIPLPAAPGAPEGSFGVPSQPAGSSPGNFIDGAFIYGPLPGRETPTGYLIGPRGSSSSSGLTATEVDTIVMQAVKQANITRAQVRLPYGLTAQFIIAISDLDGRILAEFRMPDALFDAVDVVPSKARNAYYFSTAEGYNVLKGYVDASGGRYRWEPAPPAGQGWALTSRTIGFGGQPLFPPGIDQRKIDEKNNNPGPWYDLFLYDTRNPCTEGSGPSRGGNRAFLNQNGITWFAGSAPLYKNGNLVAGIGVSGDGTEQNDLVTQAGAVGFEPPDSLRVDNSTIITSFLEPVRLPYLKFPRNPEQF